MARHRTTIRELAEYTGLSPAAVSYALRGMQVSAETERRVREAAEELGYEADPIARALAGGATAVVGLLVGSLGDFWNQELVRAVQRELYGADRSTLVADADGEPARELELASGSSTTASTAWSSCRSGRRAAAGRRSPGRCPRSRSATRSRRGPGRRGGLRQRARRAGDPRHLSALGHRRVTVLSWAVETSPDREAERAVAAAAAALGLDCRVVPCAYSLNGSRPLALELLAGPDRPTAVLCMSDSIAYGVYAACAELGLSIPGDVAVAGFGDHPISRLLAPPLTSTVWDVERGRPSFPAPRRSARTARRRRSARSSRRCSSRARRRTPELKARRVLP